MHKDPAEFNLQKIYDLDTMQSIQHRTRNIYIILSSRTIVQTRQEYFQISKFNLIEASYLVTSFGLYKLLETFFDN